VTKHPDDINADTWIAELGRGSSEKKRDIMALLIEGKMKQREIAKAISCNESYVSQVKREAIKRKRYLDKAGKPTKKGKEFLSTVDISAYYDS